MTHEEFIRRLKMAREPVKGNPMPNCLGCRLESVGLYDGRDYTTDDYSHNYFPRDGDWLRACIDNSIAELEKTR